MLGHANVLVLQHKLAALRVEAEGVDAAARGQHQRGAGAVEAVARRQQLGAPLEQRLLPVLIRRAFRPPIDAKDRAGTQAGVDVGRAVQRVEDHCEVARERGVLQHMATQLRHIFLLGRHAGHTAAGADGGLEDAVGHHVQLLLVLALHVHHGLSARLLEHAVQVIPRGVAHQLADGLARVGQRLQRGSQRVHLGRHEGLYLHEAREALHAVFGASGAQRVRHQGAAVVRHILLLREVVQRRVGAGPATPQGASGSSHVRRGHQSVRQSAGEAQDHQRAHRTAPLKTAHRPHRRLAAESSGWRAGHGGHVHLKRF
mmetsp:Transcript_3911/g.15144  ORF Transcript_3911/g.15144 Transcript_3911/m.15144 type:complete len:315 (+) Transcript_3911:438-1382(+)